MTCNAFLCKKTGFGILLLLGVLFGWTAGADDGFDLQQFHPAPRFDGGFLSSQSGGVGEHLSGSAFLLLNYAHKPLVLRDSSGDSSRSLVKHQGTLHLLGSFSLFRRVELGVDIPLLLFQGGEGIDGLDISPEDGGFGIGDVRLVPKVLLFSNRQSPGDSGVAIALALDAHLPTGKADVMQGGDFRIGPRLAADYDFGPLMVGANFGYVYRRPRELANLEVRDYLRWSVSAALPIERLRTMRVLDSLSVLGDLYGQLSPAATAIVREEVPMEVVLGMMAGVSGFRFFSGAGYGLVNGYGTPQFRLLAGVGYAFTPAPPPEPQEEVACQPETVETDCSERRAPTCDDGVLRTFVPVCQAGQCSESEREAACPEGWRCGEADGIAACVEPECYVDSDCVGGGVDTCEDGVVTRFSAACVAGDCELASSQTRCEEGFECGRTDGKPACVEVVDLVSVDAEKAMIRILEVVYFAVNSEVIEERSFRLLNQVAQVLENHPEIVKVRVEGHTDSRGNRARNIDLSKRRATSVRDYLIGRNIAPERLITAGYGPDRPLADNRTEAGRAANRRVEFHIVEE